MLRSKVGRVSKFDYSLTFHDAQILERIRRKLVKASLILRSNVDIAESLGAVFDQVGMTATEDDVLPVLHTIRQHTADLRRHERVVESLLDRLAGTSKLVFSEGQYHIHTLPYG